MTYNQAHMEVIAKDHGVTTCPYCGHWPDIADDETGFGIFCRNPECTIQPGLYLDNEEDYWARGTTIETWNRRGESRAAGREEKVCPWCSGSGTRRDADGFGRLSEPRQCLRCAGAGKIADPPEDVESTDEYLDRIILEHGAKIAAKMKAEARESAAGDGWVDASERMPEPEQTVMWCRVPVCEPYCIGSLLDDSPTENFAADFTHWRPLPPPPTTAARREDA